MSYHTALDRISQLSSAGDHARQKPRFNPDLVNCNRGKLIDLSASGLAVRAMSALGKPGTQTVVDLTSPNGTLKVEVQIVRVTRRGLFAVETGCRFVHAEAVAKQLFNLFQERVGSGRSDFMIRSA